MFEPLNTSRVTVTSYPTSLRPYPLHISGISFLFISIVSPLPPSQRKDSEHQFRDHHDVLPNVDPCAACDLGPEPLPFGFPDRSLDCLGAGPGLSAPFPTQEVPEIPFTQYIPDISSYMGPYPDYNSGIQDHMAREVNGCFSPHPAVIRIPQSSNPAMGSGAITPVYTPSERRFQSNSSKRVLFSPVYAFCCGSLTEFSNLPP